MPYFLIQHHQLKMVFSLLFASILLIGCMPGGSDPKQVITPGLPTESTPQTTFAANTPTIEVDEPLLPDVTPTKFAPASFDVSGLIAFASDMDGDFEIWVMNNDGSEPRRLTDNDSMDISPCWSPHGTQIVFISNRDGNDEIYIMDADGSNTQRLTNSEARESFPTFSPDGMQISFDANREGNWDIYMMASDGSDTRRLTNHPSDDWISSWSPDGEHIIFESNRDGDYEIYVMDSDGGNQKPLTDNQVHDGYPSLSPDGSQIAFMSMMDGNYEVYVMDSNGKNRRRITDTPAEDSDPAWSPDGRWFSLVSHRDGNAEIYIMQVNGSQVTQLTDNGAQNWSPAWQPSGSPEEGSQTWVRNFAGPDYGAFFDLTRTPGGNFLAIGATNHLHVPPYSGDMLWMEFNLEGEVVWENTWGGAGYEQARAVVNSLDGGYYIFGETDSHGAGDRDFLLLKINPEGEEEWFKTYGDTGREWPFGMLQLSNADLLIFGFTTSPGNQRDQFALRLAPDGTVIWEYKGASPEEELVLDAVETPDGDLVLVVNIEEDGKIVKLDRDGNLIWENRFDLAGWQYASNLVQTPDGGFLLAGFSMNAGPPQQADTWLARSSPTGELEWETSFGDPEHDDYAISLIALDDGSYLIGGLANGVILNRVDGNGNMLWQRSLLAQDVYGASGLLEVDDGGFLVAGFLQLIGGRSYDAILLRTDSQGLVNE